MTLAVTKSSKKVCRGNINGFTLLEVLVAIAIFAAIVSVLYPTYTATFRNIEYTESEADIYEMARITMERITRDIKSVYIPSWVNEEEDKDEWIQKTKFLAEDQEMNGRSADTLRFFSREHLSFKEDAKPGNAFIAYYIKEREDESFALYRSDTHEFDEPPEEESGGFILCENMYSLEFTCFDKEGESYDNWDSSDDRFEKKLPVMASVKLEFIRGTDDESVIRFMTSVSLPMAINKHDETS